MFECTKNMENVSLSPTLTSKLKNRDCANNIRHGSPKLQDVLRQRCRLRMREKRGQLFNRRRFGLEINSKDVQNTLSDIVRKELNDIALTNLDPTLNPFSPIINEPLDQEEALELENEILNEQEQWILEEYERMTQEIESLALSADQINEVVCPICQISNLIEQENKIYCESCNFILNNCISLNEVRYLINNCVSTHSAQCKELPSFLSLPEDNISLYLICDQCSTWIPII